LLSAFWKNFCSRLGREKFRVGFAFNKLQ